MKRVSRVRRPGTRLAGLTIVALTASLVVVGAALAGPPPDDTTTTTAAPETTTTTTPGTSTSAPETTTTAPGSTEDHGQGDVGALVAYQVTDGDDSGGGSYRQAILDASNDTDPVVIDFAPGLTVTLTADVVYTNTEPITLNGNGSTIDGGDAHQILEALGPSSVTVNDLTFQNGETTGAGGAIETFNGDIDAFNSTFSSNIAGGGGGGGVATAGGSITISHSTFSGNTANTGGGALIALNGSFTISDSTFSGNSSSTGDGGGAFIFGAGSYTISDSTFSGNTASGNTASDGAGAYTSTGSYTISGSTFSGNIAGGDGGGIRAAGSSATIITVTNSTFSGNAAADGAAMFTGGRSVSFAYATVVSNTSATANVFAGAVTSFGSVFALSGGGTNCGGPAPPVTTSHGWNFSDETSCGFTNTGRGDSQAAGNNPQLGSLANNGGPTQTHMPQPGSPLINAIPGANCQDFEAAGITGDQRGAFRPQGPGCDIGAVERRVCPPATQASVGVGTLAGAEGVVAAAPVGFYALLRRRRRGSAPAGSRRERLRAVVTWLMVAGVAVAVLAACQPVKKTPPFC